MVVKNPNNTKTIRAMLRRVLHLPSSNKRCVLASVAPQKAVLQAAPSQGLGQTLCQLCKKGVKTTGLGSHGAMDTGGGIQGMLCRAEWNVPAEQ